MNRPIKLALAAVTLIAAGCARGIRVRVDQKAPTRPRTSYSGSVGG